MLSQDMEKKRITVVLPLRGHARALVNGERVRLRRKGIALLYYLSLEGPTRRDDLARLLWEQGRSLANLRVEIHRLRAALEPFGVNPFTDHADPLYAANVSLDEVSGAGELLDSLDDVTPAYQEWLERQRLVWAAPAESQLRAGLVKELADAITLPFVLVVAGAPGSGRCELAQDLASKLRLPFVRGCGGSAPAVNYVTTEAADCHGQQMTEAIDQGAQRLFVLERSLFGEDPEVLLHLRSTTAPERMRFVSLAPLNWWEAQSSFPSDMPFSERARYYLTAHGNRRYLAELLKLSPELKLGAPLPVPLTVRAEYALEARRLSSDARKALEGASVHRGTFSQELLRAVGVEPHLAELEAGGWLKFDGLGWRFSSELARRMLLELVPEGTRHLLTNRAAQQLESEGHGAAARALITPASSPAPVPAGAERITPRPEGVMVGEEILLDEPILNHPTMRLFDDKVVISRTGQQAEASVVTWELDPSESILFRLRGRVFLADESHREHRVPPAGLMIHVEGAPARELHLTSTEATGAGDERHLRLPLTEKLDCWFVTPPGRELRIKSHAHSAVLELQLNAFGLLKPKGVGIDSSQLVQAYSLERPNDSGKQITQPPRDRRRYALEVDLREAG